jgi:hypothetical protein
MSKIYVSHSRDGRVGLIYAENIFAAYDKSGVYRRPVATGEGYIDLTGTWLGDEIAEQVKPDQVRRVNAIQDGLSGEGHIRLWDGDPL